jgi:hypothetical protein
VPATPMRTVGMRRRAQYRKTDRLFIMVRPIGRRVGRRYSSILSPIPDFIRVNPLGETSFLVVHFTRSSWIWVPQSPYRQSRLLQCHTSRIAGFGDDAEAEVRAGLKPAPTPTKSFPRNSAGTPGRTDRGTQLRNRICAREYEEFYRPSINR